MFYHELSGKKYEGTGSIGKQAGPSLVRDSSQERPSRKFKSNQFQNMDFKKVFSPVKNNRYQGPKDTCDMSSYKNIMSSKESLLSNFHPAP